MRIKTKLQDDRTNVPVPKAVLCSDLTLEEKGLYSCLCITGYIDIENEDIFNSLISKGYVRLNKDGSYSLLRSANIKDCTKEVKVETKSNAYLDYKQVVSEYCGNDLDLARALMDYFVQRFNKVGRYKDIEEYGSKVTVVKRMLTQLSELKGNKVEIVKHCTKGQYFKFFEMQPTNISMDGLQFTQAQVMDMRQKLKELESC